MAPRSECKPVRILDAFRANLAEISGVRFPDKWLTTPKTVDVGFLTGDFARPRPAILIFPAAEDDEQMISGDRVHEVGFDFNVLLVSELTEAGRELMRLRSDVLQRVAADDNLGGLVYNLRYVRGELALDAMERVQFGVFNMLFRGTYAWIHGSP